MSHLSKKDLPYNLAEIKKQAKQLLDSGAVTQDYPLNLVCSQRLQTYFFM